MFPKFMYFSTKFYLLVYIILLFFMYIFYKEVQASDFKKCKCGAMMHQPKDFLFQ